MLNSCVLNLCILARKGAMRERICKKQPIKRNFSGVIRVFGGGVSLAAFLPRRKRFFCPAWSGILRLKNEVNIKYHLSDFWVSCSFFTIDANISISSITHLEREI